MAHKLFLTRVMKDHEDTCTFSVIYASETEMESDAGDSDIEIESETWISERRQLLQMSHSILSPSFVLDDSRRYVSESEVSSESENEFLEECNQESKNESNEECDEESDIESIFANSSDHDVLSDVSETNLPSEVELAMTQEKLEKYFEIIEEKERELGRRLDVEETDVIYQSIFNC